jgi:hypothetical protein
VAFAASGGPLPPRLERSTVNWRSCEKDTVDEQGKGENPNNSVPVNEQDRQADDRCLKCQESQTLHFATLFSDLITQQVPVASYSPKQYQEL